MLTHHQLILPGQFSIGLHVAIVHISHLCGLMIVYMILVVEPPVQVGGYIDPAHDYLEM